MGPSRILAMIMAGGEGRRLYPLTTERSKPAVPFGGRYRVVDFVLSNFINSEIHAIYLLVQYKSQSLIEHVRKSWVLSPITPAHFITIVPPQMRGGNEWFQGTADAVYQNLNLIYRHQPAVVAVFGADHIYRMDIRQMVDFHRESDADVTVAALPIPLTQCANFGVITTDTDGRVREFQEKPTNPACIPGDPTRCFASMGNYLFRTEALIDALESCHGKSEHDFGHNVLPMLKSTHRVYAYNFATNKVPGIKPYEEPAYWRDVGTIEAYVDAHRDVLGMEPRFDIFNTQWPILSGNYLGPVAKIMSGDIKNSIIGGGTLINGARIHNSVIRREVKIEEDVEIEDSIIMDYTVIRKGVKLKRVIIDRHNIIAPGTRIGYNHEEDAARYHVSPSGFVVLPHGRRRFAPFY